MINYVVELLITIILAVFLSWCVMTFRLCLCVSYDLHFLSVARSLIHTHSISSISIFPFNISVVSSVSRSTLNRPTHTTHDSSPSRALIYMKFYSLCMHTRAALLLRDHPRRAFAVVKFTSLFATAISYVRESRGTTTRRVHVALFVHSLQPILRLTSSWEM